MFDTICTLPLTSDLFTQAIHPSESIVAVGLSGGHVQCLKLPPVAGDDEDVDDAASASDRGYGQIETTWRTKRHKGSCRALGFSLDGEALYSAGTDGIVKAATVESGRVYEKIAIPNDSRTGDIDSPTLLHLLSPQSLLLATDSAALHLYDLRANDRTFEKTKPQQTFFPHDDYVSSLTPLPPSNASTSGFSRQWVSTGSTTIAVTDVRRGVLVKSEDQEEELLSSLFVSGLSKRGTSQGEKVLAGSSEGVITLWERGVWDDQDERIVLDRTGQDSVDALVKIPDSLGMGGRTVVAGMGSGILAFVKLGANKIVDVLKHDEVEGVVAVGFENGGRMISGGGQVLKVWREKIEGEDEEKENTNAEKRGVSDSDENSDDDESEKESSEEDAKEKRRRKKRKKGKGLNGFTQDRMFKGLD